MLANELMIGDLVYYSHTEDGIAPYKEVICIQWEDLCRDSCVIETHFEPIPLTPEILEKNGFEKEIVSGDTYFTLDDIVLQNDYEFGFDFGRFYRDSEDGFVLVSIITIKFVHQLQQALRLCQIDKNIEL